MTAPSAPPAPAPDPSADLHEIGLMAALCPGFAEALIAALARPVRSADLSQQRDSAPRHEITAARRT